MSPQREADTCLGSRRADGAHCWLFDGDDPYVVCPWCHECRDALTGRVITAGRRPPAPQRIQMSRQRPWRAEHPDAVIVARPSRWGNPYRAVRKPDGHWTVRDDNDVEYEAWIGPEASKAEALADCVRLFADVEVGYGLLDRDEVRRELAGRDLACWCPPSSACHADVLLELANREGS